MNCPLKTEEAGLLLDYAAGRLDAQTTAMLNKHMQTCVECAAMLRDHATVWKALDAWEPAPVTLDFNRRLWQRIGAMEAAPWYERLADSMRMSHWKPALTLAVATLIIAAGFMLDHPGSRIGTPGAGVSATEAEQVEQTLEDLQLLHQFDSATAPVNNVSKKM
ncbi:MAG TPA: hypothetical protein VG273_09860 [Bryobacteraceae bacterium]|jgi:anti-sigma factor RsiW|nr:hypothetical protein [Bryobacteraceae bacterium]